MNNSTWGPTYKDQVRSVDPNRNKPEPERGSGNDNETSIPSYSDPATSVPLAQGVQVLGDATSSAVPPLNFGHQRNRDVDDDDDSVWHFRIKKSRTFWCSTVLLVAATVFVATYCGTGSCASSSNKESTSSSNNNNSDGSPPEAGGTAMPVSSPVTSESASPTVATDTIVSYINHISLLDEESKPIEYFDPLHAATMERDPTPEELALHWIIQNDYSNSGDFPISSLTASDQERFVQRYALLTLWFGSSPEEHPWNNATNWLNGDNECKWYGITCEAKNNNNNNNVVVKIDLDPPEGDGNNVHGRLSPELGLLRHLRHFEVDTNELTGTLPTTIGLWTDLEHFEIDSNNLTGTLPAQVGFWSNLVEFYGWGNEFVGNIPSSVGSWSGIATAMFQRNQFTGSMPFCRVEIRPAVLEADCQVECPCCTDRDERECR